MTYAGRPGPNVSNFISQLNAIQPVVELTGTDDFSLDDLSIFTNTQFFDFDLGQDADLQPSTYDLRTGSGDQAVVAPDQVDLKSVDFNLPGDFNFPDFAGFPETPFNNEASHAFPSVQTNQPYDADPSTVTSSSSSTPVTGSKRKASSPAAENYEEASRMAAEEDKRRRNTAASARFRVKKKQREQALERSAKEMSDKVSALEGRINQLETENKWLKNLITEKNESKEDIAALWKKHSQETAARKAAERKDGVGTKAAASKQVMA